MTEPEYVVFVEQYLLGTWARMIAIEVGSQAEALDISSKLKDKILASPTGICALHENNTREFRNGSETTVILSALVGPIRVRFARMIPKSPNDRPWGT